MSFGTSVHIKDQIRTKNITLISIDSDSYTSDIYEGLWAHFKLVQPSDESVIEDTIFCNLCHFPFKTQGTNRQGQNI